MAPGQGKWGWKAAFGIRSNAAASRSQTRLPPPPSPRSGVKPPKNFLEASLKHVQGSRPGPTLRPWADGLTLARPRPRPRPPPRPGSPRAPGAPYLPGPASGSAERSYEPSFQASLEAAAGNCAAESGNSVLQPWHLGLQDSGCARGGRAGAGDSTLCTTRKVGGVGARRCPRSDQMGTSRWRSETWRRARPCPRPAGHRAGKERASGPGPRGTPRRAAPRDLPGPAGDPRRRRSAGWGPGPAPTLLSWPTGQLQARRGLGVASGERFS